MASTPARILTVCTGNICRSPFLERALQAELDRSWGPGAVEVSSGGTGALAGHPMEPQARALLEANGYAADGFLARHLTSPLVADADLVLTATRAHRGKAMTLHPKAVRYTFTFREFAHLACGLTDDELRGAGLTDDEMRGAELRGDASDQAREHVARVVTLAAGQRGMGAPLAV